MTEQEKKWEKEVKKLTQDFEEGIINGFEFNRRFRELDKKYLRKNNK